MRRPTSALARKLAFAVPTSLAMLFGATQAEATAKTTPPPAPKVLHTFAGGKDGLNINNKFAADTQGNIWGTTEAGGKYNKGTIFKYSPSTKKVTIEYNFGGTLPAANKKTTPDSAYPSTGLVKDQAGNFYGDAYEGGTANAGTIFKFSPATGKEVILYNNPIDSKDPSNKFDIGEENIAYIQGKLTPFFVSESQKGPSQLIALTPSGSVWKSTVKYTLPNNGASFYGFTIDKEGAIFTITTIDGGKNQLVKIIPTSSTGAWNAAPVATLAVKGRFFNPGSDPIVDTNGVVYGIDLDTQSIFTVTPPTGKQTTYKFAEPFSILSAATPTNGVYNLMFDTLGGFYARALYNGGRQGGIEHIDPPSTIQKNWTEASVAGPLAGPIFPGIVSKNILYAVQGSNELVSISIAPK